VVALLSAASRPFLSEVQCNSGQTAAGSTSIGNKPFYRKNLLAETAEFGADLLNDGDG
jgi:hypothetical protein